MESHREKDVIFLFEFTISVETIAEMFLLTFAFNSNKTKTKVHK